MSDPNSADNIEARASQEDPLVMYLIIREDINMSLGKSCAQCAHASQMLLIKYTDAIINNDISILSEQHKIFGQWLQSSFRKVVLKADDKEWAKLKVECQNQMIIVRDAGFTELSPGTETVIGLFPMYKSQAPKVIKRLQISR